VVSLEREGRNIKWVTDIIVDSVEREGRNKIGFTNIRLDIIRDRVEK
jgi:hypothetical protein